VASFPCSGIHRLNKGRTLHFFKSPVEAPNPHHGLQNQEAKRRRETAPFLAHANSLVKIAEITMSFQQVIQVDSLSPNIVHFPAELERRMPGLNGVSGFSRMKQELT
jgi:hypothetical protein